MILSDSFKLKVASNSAIIAVPLTPTLGSAKCSISKASYFFSFHDCDPTAACASLVLGVFQAVQILASFFFVVSTSMAIGGCNCDGG